MENKYKIGVLFCGGCNCYFDRENLFDEIKSKLEKLCKFEYYSTDSEGVFDLIVLINGCQSECLLSENFNSELLLINNKNYHKAVELIREKLLK